MHVLAAAALIGAVAILLYPAGRHFLFRVRAHSYVYGYSPSNGLAAEDTSALPPAQAVPILMYHGVLTHGQLGANTERKAFIAQMEILKRKGYETISVREYDLFREGVFTLPPKPMIITFDDGRRDSFYTVDKVFEKLGFRGTMFVATIKANEGDPFYLSWDELARVRATGRWEIEAHGRHSHDKVPMDENGTPGTYLTSRAYTQENGLESAAEYRARVDADYRNGITDLKEHLGIEARYFAVPLNDYGDYEVPNYTDAYAFNRELTRRFFKLAFIQAEQEEGKVYESFYNYSDSDPYALRRLEVRNKSPEELLRALERFSPKPPALVFPGEEGAESFLENTQLLYGSLKINGGIMLASDSRMPSARAIFGDRGWRDYRIQATIARQKGRSASLVAYYTDEDNFLRLAWSEQLLKLIERVAGKERELAAYYPWEDTGAVEIALRISGGMISAYFSGIAVAYNLPIHLPRGAAGFSVWDPNGAEATIQKFQIDPLPAETFAVVPPAV